MQYSGPTVHGCPTLHASWTSSWKQAPHSGPQSMFLPFHNIMCCYPSHLSRRQFMSRAAGNRGGNLRLKSQGSNLISATKRCDVNKSLSI